MSRNPDEFGSPIKATERSVAILEEVKRRDGAGVTELADHFGFSKSTVHDHLVTLVETGLLGKDGSRYEVGLRALDFGGYARRQGLLYELTKDVVDELAAETGESVKVVVEEGGRGIYLYQARGDRAVRTDAHVGTRVYLHRTATGKAILAELPDERVDRIVDEHGLPAGTERTITDRSSLRTELAEIRERGVAFDDEERIPGIRCVAAPIRRDGEVLGAMSVSGPTKRFRDELFREELPDLVADTAQMVEIEATYS